MTQDSPTAPDAARAAAPCHFRMDRRVQFAEVDMAGVMHFSNYFRMMEEVEHAFYRSMGLSIMMRDADAEIGWPRARVSCEYLAPVRFEDIVELRLRVTHIGTKSVGYEIDLLKDGEMIASGTVRKVCCRVKDRAFEAVNIPDRIRRRLEEAMACEP